MTKPKITLFTGAGMSAESGIKTFRDSDGLWEKYAIEEVATPDGFAKNPSKVLEFYNQRREQLLSVQPNRGHYILAELEKEYDIQVITQNVDNLHERAGSTSVLHLHGELMKVQSTGNPNYVVELTPQNPRIHIGSKCPKGYQLRPHIVWFGEPVPMLEVAIPYFQQADICIVVGTSLNVYPAAGLLHYLPTHTPIYLIDPNIVQVSNSKQDITYISKGASEGLNELKKLLFEKTK